MEINKRKESGCDFRGKIWAKLGPVVNRETGIANRLFSCFAWGVHLKEKGSGYRSTWVEIEGKNSKKYQIWKKRTKFLPHHFGWKIEKPIIFEVFILVSQS